MRIGIVLTAEEAVHASDLYAASQAIAEGEIATFIIGVRPPEAVAAPGTVVAGVSPDLERPDSGQLLTALRRLLGDGLPDIVLFRDGALFESVGARLAGTIGRTAVRGGVGIRRLGSDVVVTKPAFGGKAELEIRVAGGAVIALAQGAGEAEALPPRAPEVVDLGPLEGETAERSVHLDASADALGEARVVVSGGRGLGSREAYEGLAELAGLLGGALGASRAAVDEGWASATRQVGLTGQKVAPDLYLSIGISGASQHLAGIGGARKIIAVTKDEKAPILEAADVGVVADWHALWPELRKALEKAD